MRSVIVATMSILIMILLLAGCASHPASNAAMPDPHAGVPNDFSLDLTIMAGPEAPQGGPVHLRPGRFILFPDGSLHYADDPEQFGTNWRPSQTRVLNREQIAQVWSLVQAENLGDSAVGQPGVNLNLIKPQSEELLYVLAVTSGNDRWLFEESTDAEDPDSSMVRLVRELGALAWATDIDTSRTHVIPKRYDFGPDPYAPYRK